jgi:hypothetical protein
MRSRILPLDYDGERVTFDVDGDTAWGSPDVLLDGDDNLIAGRPWADAGFSVEPFLDPSDYDRLVAGIHALLVRRIEQTGLSVPADFAMERYHEVVTTDAAHQAVSDQGPWCYGLSDLPVPADVVSARISEILGVRVSTAPRQQPPAPGCVARPTASRHQHLRTARGQFV